MSSLPPPPPPPPPGGSPWRKFVSTPVLGALLAALLVVGAGVAVLSSGSNETNGSAGGAGSPSTGSAPSLPSPSEATVASTPPPPIKIGRVRPPYDAREPRVQHAVERGFEDQLFQGFASCHALTSSSVTCVVTSEGASETDEIDVDQETGELSWVSREPR
jgi:hypothetical protein